MMIEGTFLAPRRIRALITLGGVAVVCACSSTHPTATVVVTPADFARHIDSLYAATGNTNRQTFLTYLEYAPAFGATPTVVRLSPGGVEQIWKGYVWEDVAGPDSTSVLIAYSDATVAMGLFLLQSNNQASGVGLLVDSVLTTVTTSTFSITSGAPHGACTLATGLTNPALVTAEQNFTCEPETFTIAADLQVPGVLTGDSATTENVTLSIPQAAGIRLQN
jgi:hypothetical protein